MDRGMQMASGRLAAPPPPRKVPRRTADALTRVSRLASQGARSAEALGRYYDFVRELEAADDARAKGPPRSRTNTTQNMRAVKQPVNNQPVAAGGNG